MAMAAAMVVAAGVAAYSANKSSKAATSAAQTQAGAADNAAQVQWDMYSQSRADTAPWRAAGVSALSALLGAPIYGQGTGATTTTPAQATPAVSSTPAQATTAQATTTNPSNPYNLPDWLLAQLHAGTADPNVIASYLPANLQAQLYPASGAPPTYESQYGSRQPGSTWDMGTEWERQNDVSIANPPLWRQAVAQLQQSIPGGAWTGTGAGVGAQGMGNEVIGYAGGGLLDQGPGEFTESPGYQFTLGEGMKGIERMASATGRLGSGASMKAGARYAEGLASLEYDNFLRRYYESLNPYFSLAGMGQLSAGQSGQNALTAGGQIGQSYMAGGQAQAAGQLGGAYPYSQFANWGASNLMNYGVNQMQQPQQPQNYLTNSQWWGQTPYTAAGVNQMGWL